MVGYVAAMAVWFRIYLKRSANNTIVSIVRRWITSWSFPPLQAT